MLGRVEPVNRAYMNFTGRSLISTPTIDYSRVIYALSRAIFYASIVTDRKSGTKYGESFQYGAVFGKAIVNSTAAFVAGESPHIETAVDDDESGEIQNLVNTWYTDNDGQIFKLIRNSMRDGDSYIRVNKDLTVDRIAADLVTKKLDPATGKVLGYDVEWTVDESTPGKKETPYVIKEEYRKTSPYYVRSKVDGDTTTEQEKTENDQAGGEERPLPIIHLANEQEANEVYGNTDYQNVYRLMSAYHAAYNSWSENIVFNNTAVPIIEGLENPKEFMEANGKKDDKGNYQIPWKGKSVLIIGKGGSARFMQTDAASSQNSEKFLDKTFTLIAVASETPEFFLGKEMNASYASVKQQMPIMIAKAQRKQKEFTPAMNELTDLVLDIMYRNAEIKKLPAYKFVWGKITDDDLELNLKIIETLKREGIITDHTAAVLAGLGKYVEDIDEEIAEARIESAEKSDAVDPLKVKTAEEQLEDENNPAPDDAPVTEMNDPKKKTKRKTAKRKTK